MPVSCIIEREDEEYFPRPPYTFSELPRVGEIVALEWNGSRYPEFIVTRVIHVPDDLQDRPSFIVIHVKRI